MLPLFFYAEGGAARMSAIGDYVHLRKSNYNKYGIEYHNDKPRSVIQEQIGVWTRRRDNIQKQFAHKVSLNDPLEKQLNDNMNKVYSYMYGLQNDPDMTKEKEAILQEILGANWAAIVKQIQIDFQSGKVSANKNVSLINNDTKEFFSRIAENAKTASIPEDLIDSETQSLNLRELILKIKKACQDYNAGIKSAMGKEYVAKHSKYFKELTKLFGDVQRLSNKLKSEYKILDSPTELGVSGAAAQKKGKWIEVDPMISRTCAKVLELIKKLRIPSLNTIRGDLMEVILARAVEQGTINGLTVVNEALSKGKLQTDGIVSREFNSNIEQYLAQMLGKKTFKNEFKIKHQVGKDDVQQAILEYHYTSQKKADGIFRMVVGEDPNLVDRNLVGISVKNYSYYKFGLVSGQPLMTFLFGGNLSNDAINHFLNIEAAASHSKRETADLALASQVQNLRAITNVAIGMMILYSAATGQGVGKSSVERADYLVFNDSNDSTAPPKAISINRLINNLLTKYDKGIYVNVGSENGPNIMQDASALLLDNNMENASAGPSQEAAYKRIAKVVSQLHQIKIYASVYKAAVDDNLTT